jgi:hypothetical protein
MKSFKQFIKEDDIDSYENRMTAGLGQPYTPYGGGRFGGGYAKFKSPTAKKVRVDSPEITNTRTGEKVYRVDDKKIDDFNKNIQTYASKPDGSESGKFARPQDIPSDWIVQKGLYGTTNKPESVGYVFPRGTKNTTVERPGKPPTMVIDKRPSAGHTPTVSTFERTPDWKQTMQGGTEVFSKAPGKPVSQETVKNPMQYAKEQGVRVVVGAPARYRRLAQKILANKSEQQRAAVRITGEE